MRPYGEPPTRSRDGTVRLCVAPASRREKRCLERCQADAVPEPWLRHIHLPKPLRGLLGTVAADRRRLRIPRQAAEMVALFAGLLLLLVPDRTVSLLFARWLAGRSGGSFGPVACIAAGPNTTDLGVRVVSSDPTCGTGVGIENRSYARTIQNDVGRQPNHRSQGSPNDLVCRRERMANESNLGSRPR